MSDYRLLHDVARCQGHECPKRTTCLRHLALNDVGPRTPFYGRLCGGEDWASYLQIEQTESGQK